MVSWKKEFLHKCTWKILFIDTELFSKMQIFSQVFFKDFVDRFWTNYFKCALSGLITLLAGESPLKMMENALYFTLKALFVLQIFKFLFWLLVVWKNGLIRKISLISKFVTSQHGYQRIAIHILTNISRSKGNQAMKYCQLTEYNMKNIFLEKSYAKCDGETIPSLFSKKWKLSISLDQ